MAKKEKKGLHDLKEEFVEDIEQDFEEINGQEETVDVQEDIDSMEYADGKERDELDLIEEQERLHGLNRLTPFKTNDVRIFKRNLETMDRERMSELAERVAARSYSNLEDQKEELISAFKDYQKKSGSHDLSSVVAKKDLSQVFAGVISVNEIEAKLKSKDLASVQATAARLGFNPGFDKDRLISLIVEEYKRQK